MLDGPSSQDSGMATMGMPMSFGWSTKVTMWFSHWTTDTPVEYILTLLAVFLLAGFYHWLTAFRTSLVSKVKSMSDPANKLDDAEAGSLTVTLLQKYSKAAKLVLALLLGINSAVGFLVMLAIMGFNVGVFVAVVSGLTVSSFFSDF